MILQRYFMREITETFFVIMGALIVIYFSTRFASYLGQAADGKIAPRDISLLILLKMLISLKDLIPMSLYLGIFATTVRLQRDLELTAMRAAGAGHQHLIVAAFKIGACAALVVGVITLYAEPRAELAIKDIRDQTENEATIAGVKAGRFKELSGGKRIFYAESVSADEKTLQNAFVQALGQSNTGLMRSDLAYVETDGPSGDRFAVFLDGTSYAGTPGALDYIITNFTKYALRIENNSPTDVKYSANYMSTGDIIKYPGREFSAEFQWRMASPIATALLPALAVLIGIASRGANWYLGVLIAISAYFIYTNMLGVGKALIKKDILSANIGLWGIHLVMILVVCLFLYLERWPVGSRRRSRQELIRS